MDLKFKKQKEYDTTPGTITFNDSSKIIGVANSDGSITEYGGDNLLDLRWPKEGTGSLFKLNLGDLLLASDLSINRFVGLDLNTVKFEYSRDGGSSWQTYDLTEVERHDFFSKNNLSVVFLGGTRQSDYPKNKDNRLKITIDLPDDVFDFYCVLQMLYLYISTNGVGSLYVDITAESTVESKRIICKKRELAGWGGGNSIYTNFTFGGQATNYHKLTFEFWQVPTSNVDSPYKNNNAFVSTIFGYASNVYGMSNSFAKTGHIYWWEKQDTIFPKNVYCGNALTLSQKLVTNSEVDNKIEEAFTWGEYN